MNSSIRGTTVAAVGTHELETVARRATPGAVDAAVRLLALSREPLVGALLSRAMHALADLAPNLDRQTMGEAAGERTDAAALLSVLEAAARDQLQQTDPLADARLRWIHDRERLLQAEGGILSSHEVVALLGVTRQAVAKARGEGRLVGLPISRGRYVYPAWQFGPAGPVTGLRAIREALGEDDPWTLAAFLLASNARLDDDTPLAVLQRGEVDAVVRAAQAYGEQGAA